MSEFSPLRLQHILDALLDFPSTAQLCVALSGGLDSVALLNAVAEIRRQRPQWKVRALHVDHQLQAASNKWAMQCKQWCDRLHVECKILPVAVVGASTQGLEAAARHARYSALRHEIRADEILLTAHHADDQLETILIALMRGAGLYGLSSMPALTRFGAGWHARPLLEFTRESLQKWATTAGLQYVDDPANVHTHFDRNYLRHEIITRLKNRWPAAAITGARSAHHLGEAQQLLQEYVAQDYAQACNENSLCIKMLMQWHASKRRAVIRHWLQQNNVLMPATQTIYALEHDMLNSANDRVPCVTWGQYAVHRLKGRLFLEQCYRPEHLDEQLHWDRTQVLSLPHQLGQLQLAGGNSETNTRLLIDASKLRSALTVRFRRGGERIQLPNENFHRELKTLLQAAGVFPWWRGRVPLIYSADNLVAVGDLWISADYVANEAQPALQVQWLHEEFSVISPF